LLEAYRDGAGALYQTPTKLFIVMTGLFLLTLNFADIQIYQYVAQVTDPSRPVVASLYPDGVTVRLENATEEELWMQRRVDPAVDPAVTTAIRAAAAQATSKAGRTNLLYDIQANHEMEIVSARLAAWLPNMLWLLMPLFALLLAPLFGRRRLLMEHLVFAMWAHVTGFALLILVALANKSGAAVPAWPIVVPYLGYFTLAARRYYRLGALQAFWRGTAHLCLYIALVLIPAMIVLQISALDLDAWVAFVLA
jgi:hypothetical protein